MSFQKFVGVMKGAFKQAKEEFDDRQNILPVGEYIGKINGCSIKKAKSSESYYVEVIYYITEGNHAKRQEYDRIMLIEELAWKVIRFFESFELDTTPLGDDETGEYLEALAAAVEGGQPTVKFKVDHYTPVGGEARPNYSLLAVLDKLEGEGETTTDGASGEGQDDSTGTGGEIEIPDFDNMDKKQLKELVLSLDLDVPIKLIASKKVEELRELVKTAWQEMHGVTEGEEQGSVEIDPEEEAKRVALYGFIESQGITEISEDMTIDQLRSVLDNTETGEQYRFDTTGTNALTQDEIAILVDNTLDHLINIPEPVKVAPVKKAVVAPVKKVAAEPVKTTIVQPVKKPVLLPGKKK